MEKNKDGRFQNLLPGRTRHHRAIVMTSTAACRQKQMGTETATAREKRPLNKGLKHRGHTKIGTKNLEDK